MAKYRHFFRRSDYQIALHNYRKARRRGDAADAQRWLKAADMHLRVAGRFDEGVHAALVRDAELMEARARKQAEMERLASVRAYQSLERAAEQCWRGELED